MIYIVSGLPRSGTSMMMQMLEAGGLPVLIDADNSCTESNPGGAYAYEKTKRPTYDWIGEAEGKVIKVLLPCVDRLPRYQYKIIVMERDPEEAIQSQQKLAESVGYMVSLGSAETLKEISKRFMFALKDFDFMVVNYNDLLRDIDRHCQKIAKFLGVKLDTKKMATVPNTDLYRVKK